MSEIFPKDVLLRIGGRTWQRYGRLAVAGAGRHVTPVPVTFTRADASTCATFADRTGTLRLAAANKLRIEWVDLDGDGVRETPGCLLEGARTQLVTDPENFGAWSNFGTPVLTAGQADPFGGTAAYLIGDDDAALAEGKTQDVTFTGDAIKSVAVFVKPNTAGISSGVMLRNNAASVVHLFANIDWVAGVPSVGMTNGTLLGVEAYRDSWYRLLFQTTSVTVAEGPHKLFLRIGLDNAADVGSAYYFGANAWNAPFPSSYHRSNTTRAADALAVPCGFGPFDTTVLARLARPVHANASGTLGLDPMVFALSNLTQPLAYMRFVNASRLMETAIRTATANAIITFALPVGAEIVACAQYRALTTGGFTRGDSGSGFSVDTGTATGFSAWGAQTLSVGSGLVAAQELYGVLLDLLVVRGLRTRAEMMALA